MLFFGGYLFVRYPPFICYSATMNCSLQSIHITFNSLVALNELPQQGQIYFLVLDGFLVFGGTIPPLPVFDPPIPVKVNCEPLTSCISSKPY